MGSLPERVKVRSAEESVLSDDSENQQYNCKGEALKNAVDHVGIRRIVAQQQKEKPEAHASMIQQFPPERMKVRVVGGKTEESATR